MARSGEGDLAGEAFRHMRVAVGAGPPCTVAIEGELGLTDAEALTRLLLDLVARESPRPVVVDLRSLTFIDSSGMSSLVQAERAARERGGSLSVLVDEGPVRRMLTLIDPGGTLLRPSA